MDQQTNPPSTIAPVPAPVNGVRGQVFTGLTPPQVGEARIREAWPSVVARQEGISGLAQRLICSVFLAPLGWLLLAPLFALSIAPFFALRYTLTNRRLMIQRGLKPLPTQEVALADIDEVRFDPSSYNAFYRCGTLQIISKGQTVMTLAGVPEPEAFRHSIINAYKAWVPGKANGPFLPASTGAK